MLRPLSDGLIFDLDGTLWDASHSTAAAWSRVAAQLNLKLNIDARLVKNVSGLPFAVCVSTLFGHYAEQIPNLKDLLDAAETAEVLRNGGTLYDGALETLHRLKRDYKLFLLSNCQEWYLEEFLERSGSRALFSEALCFGQTQRSKTLNIIEIAKRHKLKSPLYIGDTHWDQEAAFYAGAKFVFARFGFGAVNVPCPGVNALADLVAFMERSSIIPRTEVRVLEINEFSAAVEFYRAVGYFQAPGPSDKLFGAFNEGRLVGLVRLALELGYLVLRDMQVHPDFQFFGIGTQLIRLLVQSLETEECFCLPHGWLRKFYGQIGFAPVEPLDGIPSFLAARLAESKKKYPQVIVMKRLPGRQLQIG